MEKEDWRVIKAPWMLPEETGVPTERMEMGAPVVKGTEMVPYPKRGEPLELVGGAKKLFRFDGRLSPMQQMYVIAYAEQGSKLRACQAAGVSYGVVKRWMQEDAFTEALQTAVDMVKDAVEEEMLRRAMQGSDKLLLEVAKAMEPEKYNRRQSDVSVKGTVVHTWADLAKQVVIDAEVVEESPPVPVEKPKKPPKKGR